MSLAWSEKEQCFLVVPGTCPYPIHGDDGSAKDCVRKGHCGCDEREKCNPPPHQDRIDE